MENVIAIKTSETFLPIFSGFYGTNWEFDFYSIEDTIKSERENKGLYSNYDINKLKIDNESFENDVVKYFSQALELELIENNFIKSLQVQKIIHPKTYNFANDAVDVLIEYIPESISDFIYSRHESFCKYLKARYTSRDGFFSHYANDFETWENETSHFRDFSKNGHYLGSILEFICYELKIDEGRFYDAVFENVYSLNYAENLEDIINQSDNSLFEFLTKNGISKNYADYIENSYKNNLLESLSLPEKILSIVKDFENFVVE